MIKTNEVIKSWTSPWTYTTGKRADLILVKNNPLIDVKNLKDIQYVILRGKVYDKEQLDKMLNDLLE